MNDLEMVRACAVAAGIKFRVVPDNKPEHTIRFIDWPHANYWPLTDDAQAMTAA